MANLTIRNLEESLKSRLRIRAATHGRSMEDEARALLRAALSQEDQEAKGLGSAIHALFRPLGGLDDVAPLREPTRPTCPSPDRRDSR
ncbi:MAG: plasmid stabilization protein [Roseiarcus sp.]